MSSFDFSAIASLNGNASNHMLRPYSINNVEFEEAHVEDIELKTGDRAGQKVPVMKVRFKGDTGYYEESFFLPTDEKSDKAREANNWGGQQPSNFDRFLTFIAQLGQNINPKGWTVLQQALKENKLKVDDDFKKACLQIAKVVCELLNKSAGHKVQLKLVGRSSQGQVRATLPYYTGVSKTGSAYVNNQFVADLESEKKITLAFTTNELKKKQEFENLKPTDMATQVKGSEDTMLDSMPTTPAEDTSDILGLLDEDGI